MQTNELRSIGAEEANLGSPWCPLPIRPDPALHVSLHRSQAFTPQFFSATPNALSLARTHLPIPLVFLLFCLHAMNAEALLKKHGWRGAGHSLDTSGRGIKKPLLISHKQDQNGLGHKKAAWKTDDQWWMRAFDESLQNLGTGQTSTLAQVQQKGINRGGLYGFFVKGEGLIGTIGDESETSVDTVSSTAESEATTTSGDQSASSTPPTSASTSDNEDGNARSKPAHGATLKKRKRAIEASAPAFKKLKKADTLASSSGAAGPVTVVTKVFGTIGADELTRIASVVKTIEKQVKAETRSREKQGAYGLYISSKQAKEQKYFDDPHNPSKKLTQKTAEAQRQKGMRAAQKEMKGQLIADALHKDDLPNHSKWTKKEIVKKYSKVERDLETVEKAYSELKKQVGKKSGKEPVQAARQDERQSLIDAQLTQLSSAKRATYEARAAEKGQSLDDYILRRVEKNTAKKVDKADGDKTAKKTGKGARK